jgi:hypothetical protein
MHFIYIILLNFLVASSSILLLSKFGRLERFSQKSIPITIYLAVAFCILLLTNLDELEKMIIVFIILVYLYFVIQLCPCDDCQKILFDLKIVICIFGAVSFMLYSSR